MDHDRWEPITLGRLACFGGGLTLFLGLILRSEAGFAFILDHANLLFHEAGHPIVGLFSTRLEPYGGTLGQLAFPLILLVNFWRQRQPLGLAAASLWFFENWFNIARYLADARSLELPLLGGGDHDWNTILSRWGWLQFDTRIAHVITLSAWAGIALTCVWVGWRAWKDRALSSAAEETKSPAW
jgi:hypothetical protein